MGIKKICLDTESDDEDRLDEYETQYFPILTSDFCGGASQSNYKEYEAPPHIYQDQQDIHAEGDAMRLEHGGWKSLPNKDIYIYWRPANKTYITKRAPLTYPQTIIIALKSSPQFPTQMPQLAYIASTRATK